VRHRQHHQRHGKNAGDDELALPLPGFGLDDCVAVTQDGVDLPVRWGLDGRRVLPDQPVRLRFELTNARLYSYWCATGGSPD